MRTGLASGVACFLACALPTDRGTDLQIEAEAGTVQLLLGDTVRIDARVTSQGSPVPNVSLSFEVADEDVAVASPDGLLLGVGEGQTTVDITVTGFESSPTARLDLFVSRGIVIAGIQGEITTTSSRARYGEEITITGLRLDPDSLSSASIGARPPEITGYVGRDANDPSSFEQLRMRVPVVASPAEVLLVHRNGGSATRTIDIVAEDVYDLQSNPFVIDLANGDFRNRDLTTDRDDADWYRIVVPPGDYTVTAWLQDGRTFSLPEPEFAFLNPTSNPFLLDLGTSFRPVREWAVDAAGVSCGFRASMIASISAVLGGRLVMAIQSQTVDTVDFAAQTSFIADVPYGLEVRSGYHSDLPPDVFEENDRCIDADDFIPDGTTHNLTFDTPTDFDWFSIQVGSGVQPTSFTTVQRDEVEPNNSIAAPEVVGAGTLVIGEMASFVDVDVYAVDATAGTLLDIDVSAVSVQDAAPTAPLFGRSDFTNMEVDVALLDSTGTELARSGNAPSVPLELLAPGTDARIRYVVPHTGRYYVSVTGEDPRTGTGGGPGVYYGMAVMAHTVAARLELATTSGSGTSDPQLLLVERRPTENVGLFRPAPSGPANTYTIPLPEGRYYMVLYNRIPTAANYQLRATLLPPTP